MVTVVSAYGVWVMLWVAAMYNVLASYIGHGRYGQSCLYAETVETMSSAEYVYVWGMYGIWSVWYDAVSYVVKFYCC